MATRADESLAPLNDEAIGSLIEIGRALSDEPDLSVAFARVASELAFIIEFDRVAISSVDLADGTVVDAHVMGAPISERTPQDVRPLRGTVAEYLIDKTEPLLVDLDSLPDALEWYPMLKPTVDGGFRSGISVPLRSRDSLVGVLHIRSFGSERYGQADIAFAEAVSRLLAGPLATEQMRLRLEQNALEESVLAEISRIITSGLRTDEIYQQIAEQVLRLVPYKRLVIAVVDLINGTGRDEYVTGLASAILPPPEGKPLDGSMTGYMASHIRPLYVIEGDQSFVGRVPSEDAHREKLGLAAMISVPIIDQGELIGNLNVREQELSAYTLDDVRKMERIAAQIAGTLANKKLQSDISRQAAERQVLADIGRTINSTLHLEEVLEQFSTQAKKLIPFDRIVISRVDADSDKLVDTYVSGREVDGYAQGGQHGLSENVTSQAVLSGRPIAWNRADLDLLAAEMDPAADALGSGLNSLLITPLIWQGEIVGTVNFRSELPEPYGPDEIRLAEEIGAQIAGAITTARLFDESERERTIREVLAEIGQVMASSLDVDEVFPLCAEQIARLIPFDRLAIVLVDEKTGTKTDAYSAGVEIPGQEPGVVTPLANSLAEEVFKFRKPLLRGSAEIAEMAKRNQGARIRLAHSLISAIAVPLVWRDQVVAVLNIRSKQDGIYGAEHIELANLVAAQIAGSIANAALHADSERQSAEREGLAEIGRIITASHDIEEVYESFVDQARNLISFDRVVISLLEPGRETFVDAFVSGVEMPGYIPGRRHVVDETSQRAVFRGGETLVAGGEEQLALAGKFDAQRRALESGLKSRLVTPLVSQGEVIGSLNFRSRRDDTYGPNEVRVAKEIGAQIAGAISTSQLYRQSEREAEIREGLATIAVAAASDLQLDQLLEGVAGQLASLISYDRMTVTLLDADDPLTLRVAFVRGVQFQGYAVGDKVAINPEGEGQPWLWQSNLMTGLGDGAGPTLLRKSGKNLGVESWIEVPLGSPEEGPIGYLGLRSGESYEYTEIDLDVLRRIAAQITPSIINSRLHEELQRETGERELLAEIGRVIGDARSISEMFEQFKGLARDLIPSEGIGIATINAETKRLTIQEIHAPEEIEMVERGIDLPLFPSMSGEAFEQRIPVVFCPGSADEADRRSPSLRALYELGSRSFMACPLISRREILGTLLFQSATPDAYSNKHVLLADRLARQIAGKLESAQFQVQLQQEAKENELLAEVGRVISGSVDLGEMFAQFKDLARELIPIDGLGIASIDPETDTLVLAQVDTGGIDPAQPAPGQVRRRLQDSLARDAYATGKPIVYCPEDPNDIPVDYPGLTNLRDLGARSFIAAPLISHGETLGALVVWTRKPSAFSQDHARLSERLANQIAGKLEIANLMADVSKLAATVDASPDFISISDPDFTLEYTNPAGLDIMGMLPLDETSAVRAPDLFTPDDARRLEGEGLTQALRVGFWWAELEAMRSDRSSFPVEALLVPIKDSGGQVQSLSLQFRDISRRVAAQHELEESEERYRDLFENAEEMIQTADQTGGLLYANRAWLRRLGYQSGELESMTMWDVIHPDGLDEYREIFARIMAGESVGEFDAVFVAKSGQKVFVRGTANCRMDQGKAVSTRGIFRDVAARLEIERMKDEFVSMVSHELRTPLTSIRGSLGMLASGLLEDQPDQAQRMIEIASGNTDRLVRLINDILDIERIESGAIDMDLSAIDAKDVIEQAKEEMQSFADDANVRLDASPATARIMADHDRIVQTLTNLISNAVKFSEPASTVTVECEQYDGRVSFSVSDSGRGIPPEKIDAIFERFQQADSSDSRDRGGTGLGLAICRSIVEQHGGQITVESEPGVGSTFTFWLIRADAPDTPSSSGTGDPVGSGKLTAAGDG